MVACYQRMARRNKEFSGERRCAISLGTRYAVSGTEVAHGATTSELREAIALGEY